MEERRFDSQVALGLERGGPWETSGWMDAGMDGGIGLTVAWFRRAVGVVVISDGLATEASTRMTPVLGQGD